MLEHDILTQVRDVFLHLNSDYVFHVCYDPRHESSEDLIEFIKDVASCSDRLSCLLDKVDDGRLEFAIERNGCDLGVKFRGIPSGHEFTSLLLAVLNADGKGKNMPDSAMAERIASLNGPINLRTYVSLTCTNCPDVVQSLNVIALMNSQVTHEMVDGAAFPSEVEAMRVQAVPSVYANGKLLHVGRGSLGELLQKLEETFSSCLQATASEAPKKYDILVLGGGPAGISAAVYSVRKGLNVALITENVGGQVKETVGIENLISTPYITGTQLAASLRNHLEQYAVTLYENRRIESVQLEGDIKTVRVNGGEEFAAAALIIATGASWRRLNVVGESEYIGRGVAFCPHCDGPFYKGKHVAVIGGGNSGIEAAIDLAGICSKVSVFEFMNTLKADKVLQSKARSLPNIEIFTSSQTLKVEGDGEKVTAIQVRNRQTGEEYEFPLDAIFIQIGLIANSGPFRTALLTSQTGEIKTDGACRTSLPGVYAAGDVSDVPYKQIIIAMGEGAKAALSAFEDMVKGVIPNKIIL